MILRVGVLASILMVSASLVAGLVLVVASDPTFGPPVVSQRVGPVLMSVCVLAVLVALLGCLTRGWSMSVLRRTAQVAVVGTVAYATLGTWNTLGGHLLVDEWLGLFRPPPWLPPWLYPLHTDEQVWLEPLLATLALAAGVLAVLVVLTRSPGSTESGRSPVTRRVVTLAASVLVGASIVAMGVGVYHQYRVDVERWEVGGGADEYAQDFALEDMESTENKLRGVRDGGLALGLLFFLAPLFASQRQEP